MSCGSTKAPPRSGELVIGDAPLALGPSQMRMRAELPPLEASGLDAIDVEWKGERPLEIAEIRLKP